MSESDADRFDGGGASHETDRHAEDQPPREDLIPLDELEEVASGDDGDEDLGDPALSEDDPVLPRPTSEDLPESQGYDVDQGDRIAEDPVERPRMSDEEL